MKGARKTLNAFPIDQSALVETEKKPVLAATDWLPVPDGAPEPDTLDEWLKRYQYSSDTRKTIREILNGDYRLVTEEGKLLTRAANNHYKKYACNMSSYIQSIINAYLTSALPIPTLYRITDRLDWTSGDFGDPSSCLWSDYKWARASMVSHGAHAILFSDEKRVAKNTGLGRMFLVPHPLGVFATNHKGVDNSVFEHVLSGMFGTKPVKSSTYVRSLFVNGAHKGFPMDGDGVLYKTVQADDADPSVILLNDGCKCFHYYSDSSSARTENATQCLKCPFGRGGKS